jgi:steroid delta-isomerase-like uncharacterized protein
MATDTITRMSIEETRAVLERYLASEHSAADMMSTDVVFTVMATGDEHHGREAILGMLDYFYHGAFDATATQKKLVVGEGEAIGEWEFIGRHIGEFAGVPATGKDVRVPLAVAYDLEDGQIVRGRVYFEIPAFLAQVGALGS